MSDIAMWAVPGFYVSVRKTRNGGLTISGQDLRPTPPGGDEYEYELTVSANNVPLVLDALGGPSDADVVDLLVAHAKEIVSEGEYTWLKRIGAKPRLWSRVE